MPMLWGPTELSRTEQAAVAHPGWAVRAFLEQCFESKSGLGETRFIGLPDLGMARGPEELARPLHAAPWRRA